MSDALRIAAAAVVTLGLAAPLAVAPAAATSPAVATETVAATTAVRFGRVAIDGIEVACREAGAHPYKRDLKDIELHLLDTGQFALEEDGPFIAERMLAFLDRVAP